MLQTFLHRLAAAIILLAATGCYREITGDPVPARHDSSHTLTVGGIRPGQSAEEVTQLLGQPTHDTAAMGKRVWRWDRPGDVIVTVDSAGRVVEVQGPSLSANGRTILGSGASEAEVVQIFGKGKIQEHRQPGGFVISLGSKLVGKMISYRIQDVRIEISLTEDMMRHCRLYLEENATKHP